MIALAIIASVALAWSLPLIAGRWMGARRVKRLHAEYHGRGEATVYTKPGLFRRTQKRQAVLSHLPGGGLLWRWYESRAEVTGAAKAALDDAYRQYNIHQWSCAFRAS